LLALVYHGTFTRLWSIWTTDENYSHGPLVPLVAGGLAWARRAAWSAVPVQPDSRGLALVALACALQILGLRGDVFTLEACSFLAMILGLAWTFLGLPRTRLLAPAIGFLVFMMPFPNVLVVHLSYALKEITVRISTLIARRNAVRSAGRPSRRNFHNGASAATTPPGSDTERRPDQSAPSSLRGA